MQVAFRRSFVKDVERAQNKQLRQRAAETIRRVENAETLAEIPTCVA